MRTLRLATRPVPALAAAGALLARAPALAQPAPAPRPVEATPADALRGPTVNAPEPRPTLVVRDFDGALKRPETDPAHAALDLLGLDQAARARADAVLQERAALMDRIVLDNLREIVELATARQAGDDAAARRNLGELLRRARPLLARGREVDRLAEVLPPDKAAALRAIVDEYWRAAIDERAAILAGPDATERDRRRVRIRAGATETLMALGQEARRSYERVVGQRATDFEALLASLSLTPEQEATVRRVVGDLFQKSYGKPTPRQSARAFVEVWRVLDAEQRRILARRMAEERGRTPPPEPPATPPG